MSSSTAAIPFSSTAGASRFPASAASTSSTSAQGSLGPQGFSLPPPVDFDAIRRKQRALQQQQQQQQQPPQSQSHHHHHNHHAQSTLQSGSDSPMISSRQSNSHKNSPAFSASTVNTGSTPLSSFPDNFNDALHQFIETNRHDMAKLGGVGMSMSDGTHAQHQGLSEGLFGQQMQLQGVHAQQSHPAQSFAGAMYNPQPNGCLQQQQQQQQQDQSPFHHSHQHLMQPQSQQSPHMQQSLTPQHQPQPPSVPSFQQSTQPPLQPQHPYLQQHQQQHADEQARLLSAASNSFNNFAMDMNRQHAAAINFGNIDPALANCFSDARNAAQTLCDDLRNISATLRSMATDMRNISAGDASSQANANGSNGFWPSQATSAHLASVMGQSSHSGSPGVNGGPQGRPQGSSSATPAQNGPSGNSPAGGQNGNPSVEPSLLMSLLNGDGAANGMLDLFGNTPGSGPSNAAGPSNTSAQQRLSSAAAGQKRKDTEDNSVTGSESQGGSATPTSKPLPKALGKHKSRPPIEGVRRESVRYRNRKLLVDMREQLYKWLDTTEFCRIARSYPAGHNGWVDAPINPDDPSAGTRRIFNPNFEIGSDLYIANKELLEELIELGVQKVRDRPEAYGMKEGVNARDVVVDVAKDLMDSARHGYRANLKKQQEDEADAKAKSTRYKQQERHRTKVRNREVGAKRLKNPIPDALLTMGLHSDDAASDQEEMHKMDKEEWRRLRMRKLQSKRGWEALAPRWRNRHLTKAYHIADTLSKSKQMPRFRRDGGIELELPGRLWGKTLPKVIFDPDWLLENEEKLKDDPYNVTVVDKQVEGWNDDDHNLSEDTEDELERFEREMTRLNRANRKHRPPPIERMSSYGSGSGSGSGNGMAGANSGVNASSSAATVNGTGGPFNMSQHLVERGRSATSAVTTPSNSEFSASRTHSLEDSSRGGGGGGSGRHHHLDDDMSFLTDHTDASSISHHHQPSTVKMDGSDDQAFGGIAAGSSAQDGLSKYSATTLAANPSIASPGLSMTPAAPGNPARSGNTSAPPRSSGLILN